MKTLALFCTTLISLLFYSTGAFAGGSAEKVTILSFQRMNATDYVLVIAPKEKSMDWFMKGCKTFVILGTHENLDGQWLLFEKNQVTRDEHLTALSFIEEKNKTDKNLDFGYMGGGFKPVSTDNKCVVNSRALSKSHNSILSYYHKV
ncbi:MAG: hypothetical protein KDI90_09850 [Alphaproteobacteria bacterium]|nr:hypothetical protein [Alphaproteobacteria bacterium]MCB9974843.1 hypothetical protein [Rhodospirillales bacterium]